MMTNHNKKINKKRQLKQSSYWRTINAFLSISCLVFGIVYLIGMNDLTVKGFVLNDLKGQLSMLSEENQDLQTRSLTLQSYTALSPRLQDLNMVAVDDVAYLSPQASTLAKK
ncbi:hypothetical protein JXE04_03120 [Patescibacteria group bacterium]|nr:hypothetical protein [Patescibacteria group bacterium]